MFDIEISDQQDLVEIDLDRLETIARDVLTHERLARAEISIALIDSQTMRRINNTHLGHDYDTDVLSFLLDVSPRACTPGMASGAGKTIEGEILVSTKIAQEAAADHGWPVEHEMTLYLVHGLLHLLGFDDHSEDDRRLMQTREREHLSRWDLIPPGRDES